jgi:hypothetical protein
MFPQLNVAVPFLPKIKNKKDPKPAKLIDYKKKNEVTRNELLNPMLNKISYTANKKIA